MAEATKTPIDAAFEEVAETFGHSRTIRREMIDQLRKQVTKCEISEFDKPGMIQAKLLIASTLDGLLKSDEDVSLKKLKMQLARKDSETNGAVGATIVNLIKSIRATGEMFPEDHGEVDRAAALRDLKDKQNENPNLKITDGELEACGSMPTTDSEEPIPTSDQKEEDDEDE